MSEDDDNSFTTPVKPFTSTSISFRSQGSTGFVAGLPGFTVLDNVWYNNRTFYNGDGHLPSKDRVLTFSSAESDGIVDITTLKSGAHGPEGNVAEFNGTSLFFNDGWPGSWSGYFMYYHFVSEVILGSYSVLSSIDKPLPSEMKKPWNVYKGLGRRLDLHAQRSSDQVTLDSSDYSVKRTDQADRIVVAWEWNWDGKDGLSRAVSEGLVGKQGIIDPQGWKDMNSDNRWIYFERLLIADRETAHHHNPLSQKWYKMALDAYKLVPSPKALSPMREKFLSYYNLPIKNRDHPGGSVGKKVKAIYIDRQGSDRKFSDEVHQDLLKSLKQIEKDKGNAIIIDAKLENLGLKAQFELFADADIIFGVHGNGLTHEIWMPTGGIVIECFPPQTFAYDYAPISAVLGHEHIVWRENRTMPPELWEPENGGEGERLHDGTIFPLDVPIFTKWLEGKIDEMLEVR